MPPGQDGPLAGCIPEPNSSWHGTQTLGLVGATANNSVGIAGVGRNVNVLPVRVLGKCGGYDSDILVGMQWAAGVYTPNELANLGLPANPNPAKVLSMSLGSTGACSQSYRDAMTRLTAAGVVVVASAGNTAGHAVSTPANCPGFIAVGGLRHVGNKVGFSDLGPEIAISAPGGNCVLLGATEPCLYPIMTTSNAGTTTPVAGAAGAVYTDSFDAPSLGTSFAAPLVAGTVGLMLSVKPSLTPADVRSMLAGDGARLPDQRRQRRHAAVHGADRRRPARVLLHHHDVRRRHARRACRGGRRAGRAGADLGDDRRAHRRPAGDDRVRLGDRYRPERHLSLGDRFRGRHRRHDHRPEQRRHRDRRRRRPPACSRSA